MCPLLGQPLQLKLLIVDTFNLAHILTWKNTFFFTKAIFWYSTPELKYGSRSISPQGLVTPNILALFGQRKHLCQFSSQSHVEEGGEKFFFLTKVTWHLWFVHNAPKRALMKKMQSLTWITTQTKRSNVWWESSRLFVPMLAVRGKEFSSITPHMRRSVPLPWLHVRTRDVKLKYPGKCNLEYL